MVSISVMTKLITVISSVLVTVTISSPLPDDENGMKREDGGKMLGVMGKRPLEVLFERKTTEKEIDQSLLGMKPLIEIMREFLLHEGKKGSKGWEQEASNREEEVKGWEQGKNVGVGKKHESSSGQETRFVPSVVSSSALSFPSNNFEPGLDSDQGTLKYQYIGLEPLNRKRRSPQRGIPPSSVSWEKLGSSIKPDFPSPSSSPLPSHSTSMVKDPNHQYQQHSIQSSRMRRHNFDPRHHHPVPSSSQIVSSSISNHFPSPSRSSSFGPYSSSQVESGSNSDPFYESTVEQSSDPIDSHHHNIQLTEYEEAMIENITEHLSRDDPKPLLDFLGLKPEDYYRPSYLYPSSSSNPHPSSLSPSSNPRPSSMDRGRSGSDGSNIEQVAKSRNSRNRASHDSGSLQALLEELKIQLKKSKREGPQLSVVSPLDVLRQQLIYELARRRLKESQDQIQVNSDLLKSLGRRRRSIESDHFESTGLRTGRIRSKILRTRSIRSKILRTRSIRSKILRTGSEGTVGGKSSRSHHFDTRIEEQGNENDLPNRMSDHQTSDQQKRMSEQQSDHQEKR